MIPVRTMKSYPQFVVQRPKFLWLPILPWLLMVSVSLTLSSLVTSMIGVSIRIRSIRWSRNAPKTVLSFSDHFSFSLLFSLSSVLYFFSPSLLFFFSPFSHSITHLLRSLCTHKVFASLVGSDFCGHWYLHRRFTIAVTGLAIYPICLLKRLDFLRHTGPLGIFSMLYIVFLTVYQYYKLGDQSSSAMATALSGTIVPMITQANETVNETIANVGEVLKVE